MNIDNRTLLFAVAALQLLCGMMILTVLGQRHSNRQRLGWAFSFLLQGAGAGLIALRGSLPDWLTMPVANTLFLLGACLTVQAFCHLLDRRVPPLLTLRATALYALTFCIAYFAGASSQIRGVVGFFWMAYLQSCAAWIVLGRSAHHPAQRMTGGWYVLMSLMLWIQLALLIVGISTADSPAADAAGRTFFLFCALGSILASALGYVLIENELHREELAQLARLDSLTGALNRRALEMIADSEWDRHTRYRLPLAIVMVDIDHFKSINDRYGHALGDEVLRHFSHLLRAEIRQQEVIVRYGGEEFLILAPNTELVGAVQLAERIQRSMRNLAFDEHICLTASFGVAALVPTRDDRWQDLVELADRRLYMAKAAGRDCIVVDDGEAAPPGVACA
jgi:diguanylate cyclase (GGDEF)-like protein